MIHAGAEYRHGGTAAIESAPMRLGVDAHGATAHDRHSARNQLPRQSLSPPYSPGIGLASTHDSHRGTIRDHPGHKKACGSVGDPPQACGIVTVVAADFSYIQGMTHNSFIADLESGSNLRFPRCPREVRPSETTARMAISNRRA